jgi:uncharacterized coiled-coil protein SlyX
MDTIFELNRRVSDLEAQTALLGKLIMSKALDTGDQHTLIIANMQRRINELESKLEENLFGDYVRSKGSNALN